MVSVEKQCVHQLEIHIAFNSSQHLLEYLGIIVEAQNNMASSLELWLEETDFFFFLGFQEHEYNGDVNFRLCRKKKEKMAPLFI